MIVERVIEDSWDLLDQQEFTMSSPMNLGYFYGGSPVSDTASSPSHYISSSPGSPTSDSEGSLSVSWPRSKKAEQFGGIGRQTKGSFQGVRVKNPVRELLNQMRNKTGQIIEECQKSQSHDQYGELKNILGKKRTNDFMLDAPASKKPCSFQCSSFLTPPGTPNSCEMMDDNAKNEMRQESDLDLLQSIMNIKNESKPLSLNTVQVNWMNSLPQNNNSSQEQFYQDSPVAQTFSPTQTSQAYSGCSPQHTNDQYQFRCPPDHTFSPQCATDYNNYTEIQNNAESLCSNEGFQNYSIDGFLSLIESTSENTPAKMSTDSCMPAQNFSPSVHSPCNQFLDHNVVQSSPNVSPTVCQTERSQASPLQIGKSFFHWQIEQEEKKLANVSTERLLSKDADGDTCLHIAVAQGRRALSYVLASKMAALNMLDIKEHNNQSALQVAVAANQHLIVQDLISLGAQVSTTDYWGRTPLHVCAGKAYQQVLEAIQKGVATSNQYIDVDATNYDGLTPLHCAVIAHNAIVQQLQITRELGTPATDDLVMRNKAMVDTVKTMLQMGASVDARDRKSGRTALHLACEEANLELMSLFLELPNSLQFINAKAYNGNTALHVAASLQYRRAHVGAVRLLMRKGADPSVRNLENEQPVHLVSDGPVGEEIRRVLKGKSMQQRLPSY
ncbi:NF-kappa-B inhibitor zeta [Mixophyes fleayi]|uniref:NF-kappa-B inhibitor zeta n=1 Tax=Mixophyes fleayi TaxID=3061075 RepID=UPI003F4E1E10